MAANHTCTGMSCTPLDHSPRKVFDRQGWGTILARVLRGSRCHAGDGLIRLVADVYPPTGPAGLGWGLQRAALRGKSVGSRIAWFPQACPSHPHRSGWLFPRRPRDGAGTHLFLLVLLAVGARFCGNAPGVVHVQREDEGPRLGLLQLPKTKAWQFRGSGAQWRERKGQGLPLHP